MPAGFLGAECSFIVYAEMRLFFRVGLPALVAHPRLLVPLNGRVERRRGHAPSLREVAGHAPIDERASVAVKLKASWTDGATPNPGVERRISPKDASFF